ncbi:hypothetical protein B7494_g6591 [Chlorociboria aeruginascens]|nr:hypothetical protein B7494_g6591 [Chlorociboria aeruginascens]
MGDCSGRILETKNLAFFTRYHELMALKLGRKNLICFYCNNKASTKYDGLITQWECGSCDATNYLDENGDITDPPVATQHVAPTDLKYAIQRTEDPFSSPSNSLFCSTCLKNQHLYASSLAQYHIETDPKHPGYKESEKKLYAFRRDLENRYPQVCEDCEPKVLERMKEAGKTAKADYLRRLLDKSRARRAATGFTLIGTLESTGKYLWYIGLIGQLLWNIMALAAAITLTSPEIFNDYLLQNCSIIFSRFQNFTSLITTPGTWGRWSLICSIVSVWWNPKFKQMNNGFMNHIVGFGDWYKYQIILLVTRGLFYNIVGTGVLASPFSAATRAAHIFMFMFTMIVGTGARRSLKVDMTPLWTSTPTRIAHVGPGTGSPNNPVSSMSGNPNRPVNSMSDALDQILSSPSRPSPPSPQDYGSLISNGNHYARQRHPLKPDTSATPPQRSPTKLGARPSEQASPMSILGLQARLDNLTTDSEDVDFMDWTPAHSESQYRAFNPTRTVQRSKEAFGQAPTVPEPRAFWFKVPPAPITPAHRLRNPPNQPRLRVISQETKFNFFNDQKGFGKTPKIASISEADSRRDVVFAQPKFLLPHNDSEVGQLADLWDSLSLSTKPNKNGTSPEISGGDAKLRHACQGLILFVGLLFWEFALKIPTEYFQSLAFVIMLGCVLIGSRTILDNTVFATDSKLKSLSSSLGACFGGISSAAAGYGLLEVLAGRADCSNCASLGVILLGSMIVYEIWSTKCHPTPNPRFSGSIAVCFNNRPLEQRDIPLNLSTKPGDQYLWGRLRLSISIARALSSYKNKLATSGVKMAEKTSNNAIISRRSTRYFEQEQEGLEKGNAGSVALESRYCCPAGEREREKEKQRKDTARSSSSDSGVAWIGPNIDLGMDITGLFPSTEKEMEKHVAKAIQVAKSLPIISKEEGHHLNFGSVIPGKIYRSSYPEAEDFAYLGTLGLKTIVTLVEKEFPASFKSFIQTNGIQHCIFQMKGTKDGIPQAVMNSIMKVVLDQENHPLLIHCNHGKHRTGCVVSVIRHLAGWNIQSTIEEYRGFAEPKVRDCDVKYITEFDISILAGLFTKKPRISNASIKRQKMLRFMALTAFTLLLWLVSIMYFEQC